MTVLIKQAFNLNSFVSSLGAKDCWFISSEMFLIVFLSTELISNWDSNSSIAGAVVNSCPELLWGCNQDLAGLQLQHIVTKQLPFLCAVWPMQWRILLIIQQYLTVFLQLDHHIVIGGMVVDFENETLHPGLASV